MIDFAGLHFELVDEKLVLLSIFGDKSNQKYKKEFSYIDVQVAGENHDTHCGAKQFDSSEGKRFKYVSHTISGDKLKIISRSELVEAETTYISYNDTNAIKVYSNIKNISQNEICIESVSSFVFYGLNCIDNCNDMYFYNFTNSWHCECQPQKNSFFDLGLFSGNAGRSMKRISGSNTGSWSTNEKLCQGIIQDGRRNKFCMFQIESNTSWYYEIGENLGQYYLFLGGPNQHFNQWSKKLKPQECFKTVAVAICESDSLNDVIAQMTRYRRNNIRKSNADRELPSIFNEYMHLSWDSPQEKNTAVLVPEIAALGIGCYVIDCGWHDEEEYTYPFIGKWEESKKRFPGGIKSTIDLIHSYGMKAGLWAEIEGVGVLCKEMNEFYEDDAFFFRNGKKIASLGRYQLDFRNKQVIDTMTKLFEKLVNRYGIDYLKIDYNQCTGPGTERNSDSLGDGLLEHGRAYIRFIESMMEKYPDLIIENCASGGQRMDYEMLRVCHLQSTSDQVDYRKYPYIAGNILSAVLPEQAAFWSYPVADINKEKSYLEIASETTEEIVVFNMINAMLGRIHLSSHIEYLSREKRELVNEGLKCYKILNEYKKKAVPYFPMGFTDFNADWVASGIMAEKKLFLAVWNLKEAKKIVLSLKDIEVISLKVAYPLSLSTLYNFSDNILTVVFNENFQARFFEIDLIDNKY